MARFTELNQPEWEKWLSTRPQVIQDMAAKLPPDHLYQLLPNGNRCTIYAYNEDETVTVIISGEYNRILFGRNVFGISPADLIECELPGPDEELGDISQEAGYSSDDVDNILIPVIRKEMGFEECSNPKCSA